MKYEIHHGACVAHSLRGIRESARSAKSAGEAADSTATGDGSAAAPRPGTSPSPPPNAMVLSSAAIERAMTSNNGLPVKMTLADYSISRKVKKAMV